MIIGKVCIQVIPVQGIFHELLQEGELLFVSLLLNLIFLVRPITLILHQDIVQLQLMVSCLVQGFEPLIRFLGCSLVRILLRLEHGSEILLHLLVKIITNLVYFFQETILGILSQVFPGILDLFLLALRTGDECVCNRLSCLEILLE